MFTMNVNQLSTGVWPWQGRPMAWGDDLFGLLDDLEAQAEAAYDRERDVELVDRGRAEYAAVTLGSRLMASAGDDIAVTVMGVGVLRGRLARVSDGWSLLAASGRDWVVPWAAVTSVSGGSERSVAELAWSPVTRLGLGSALRRLAESGRACVVHTIDQHQYDARVLRVGKDFVEVAVGEAGVATLVPFAALAAISSRD